MAVSGLVCKEKWHDTMDKNLKIRKMNLAFSESYYMNHLKFDRQATEIHSIIVHRGLVKSFEVFYRIVQNKKNYLNVRLGYLLICMMHDWIP